MYLSTTAATLLMVGLNPTLVSSHVIYNKKITKSKHHRCAWKLTYLKLENRFYKKLKVCHVSHHIFLLQCSTMKTYTPRHPKAA